MFNDLAIMNESQHINKKWPAPQLFGVGLFTDFRLYWEALRIANTKSAFTIEDLVEELPHRVKGLIYVEGFKRRAYQDLIRELIQYGYIEKVGNSIYGISNEGRYFLECHTKSTAKSQNMLLQKMQEVFVTPAWLIKRMWDLNPTGQGQIVIPTPLKDWKSKPRGWSDNLWTKDLMDVSINTYDRISSILPNSFPIDKKTWLDNLKKEYERAGRLRPRRLIDPDEIKKVNYNPRARLSMAMKNVAVSLLFSRLSPITMDFDFANTRAQLTHRAFSVWCPRLEEFGLMVYTDYKPEIPGRLVFPTSVFKSDGIYQDYEKIDALSTPTGERLYIYNPEWERVKALFVKTLNDVYDSFYNMQRIIYISLQDIRDEVCRLIRINTKLFDVFLKYTYEEALKGLIPISISLETDLRQDMKVQVNRRGVYVNNVLYTLIAIKSL